MAQGVPEMFPENLSASTGRGPRKQVPKQREHEFEAQFRWGVGTRGRAKLEM